MKTREWQEITFSSLAWKLFAIIKTHYFIDYLLIPYCFNHMVLD